MIQKVTEEIIQKNASLAKVSLNKQEVEKITYSFHSILEMIDTINDVEIKKDIERNFTNINTLREDKEDQKTNFNNKQVVEQFPETQDNYLKTKKIL